MNRLYRSMLFQIVKHNSLETVLYILQDYFPVVYQLRDYLGYLKSATHSTESYNAKDNTLTITFHFLEK